jgi:hypothetical protein
MERAQIANSINGGHQSAVTFVTGNKKKLEEVPPYV